MDRGLKALEKLSEHQLHEDYEDTSICELDEYMLIKQALQDKNNRIKELEYKQKLIKEAIESDTTAEQCCIDIWQIIQLTTEEVNILKESE